MQIPEEFRDLVDNKNFGHIATVKQNGAPHSTPVWIDSTSDYDRILFNTAKGRVKYNNLNENPKVSISIMDQNNPYRYLMIEGEVDELKEDGAVDHINKLAQKYMGEDEYPGLENSPPRVKVSIEPTNIVTFEG